VFWSVGLWTSDTEKIAETREVDRLLFDMEYVVSLSDTSEVLEVPKCTKLRRIKRWVLEVANVRGRLLPIIDFAKCLGCQHSLASSALRVLVFDVAGTYFRSLIVLLGLVCMVVAGYSSFEVSNKAPEGESSIQAVENLWVKPLRITRLARDVSLGGEQAIRRC
jgi:chemotaxis signal transduction protein